MFLTYNDFKNEVIEGVNCRTIEGLSKMVLTPAGKGYADIIEFKLDGSRELVVVKVKILEAERIALSLLNGAFDAQAAAAWEADQAVQRAEIEAAEAQGLADLAEAFAYANPTLF